MHRSTLCPNALWHSHQASFRDPRFRHLLGKLQLVYHSWHTQELFVGHTKLGLSLWVFPRLPPRLVLLGHIRHIPLVCSLLSRGLMDPQRSILAALFRLRLPRAWAVVLSEHIFFYLNMCDNPLMHLIKHLCWVPDQRTNEWPYCHPLLESDDHHLFIVHLKSYC